MKFLISVGFASFIPASPALVTAILYGALVGSANSAVVLTVDISDQAAVVVTALPEPSAINIAGLSSLDGITLDDFFSGNTVPDTAVTGTHLGPGLFVLDESAGRGTLWYLSINDYSGGWTRDDLGVLDHFGFEMQFSTAAPALTGEMTFDLSVFEGLPSISDTGNVLAGQPGSGNVIGQWQVVPELATSTLAALGLLTAVLMRRKG